MAQVESSTITSTTMTFTDPLTIILALLSASTAGLIGSFALMKRMTLAGDAISHIALPGLGIALLLKINPILGAAAALLIGAVLIAKLEERSGLSTETTVGVIFSTSLAVGALITPSEDLIEALFGGFAAPGPIDIAFYGMLALLVFGFVYKFKNQLIISLFSPDLAASIGINVPRINLFYLLAFSLTIVLGLKFLGALLVGSLIIIPAAASRQLTHQLKSFLIVSATISALSVTPGLLIASGTGAELGPTVVSVAAGIFTLSLLKKKK